MEGDAFNGLMTALSVVMSTPMFDTADVLQEDSVVKEEEVELNDMNEDVKRVEEDAQVRFSSCVYYGITLMLPIVGVY